MLPRLMIIGQGRAGKDTAGEWLGNNTLLVYKGSSSNFALPYVAKEMGQDEKTCYETRHQNREEWKRICRELRGKDPGILVKAMLKAGADLVIGIRDKCEIDIARQQQLVDLVIWIEKDVPKDPTVDEFDSSDADIIIDNNSTKEVFYRKLKALANTLRVLKSEHP